MAERRSGDEGPGLRSPQERYGDAFSDAINLALNSPDLPLQAGERAHVMVTVSLEDLKTGVGTAVLGDLGSISAGFVAWFLPGCIGRSICGTVVVRFRGVDGRRGRPSRIPVTHASCTGSENRGATTSTNPSLPERTTTRDRPAATGYGPTPAALHPAASELPSRSGLR
jgi:hypothetical protein